jgi:hypothetical protein
MTPWKFSEPPNLAVIASKNVISGNNWIAHVSHDADDGSWQFLERSAEPLDECDAVVVSLENILQIDPSVADVSDLQLGWHAWRESKESPWLRAKI